MSAAGHAAPGTFTPVVDRNRCEGKGPCVSACPHDVLALGVLDRRARAALSLTSRIKAWAHGGRQVLVVRPDACHACGACVRVCPERAITLSRASAGATAPVTRGGA